MKKKLYVSQCSSSSLFENNKAAPKGIQNSFSGRRENSSLLFSSSSTLFFLKSFSSLTFSSTGRMFCILLTTSDAVRRNDFTFTLKPPTESHYHLLMKGKGKWQCFFLLAKYLSILIKHAESKHRMHLHNWLIHSRWLPHWVIWVILLRSLIPHMRH